MKRPVLLLIEDDDDDEEEEIILVPHKKRKPSPLRQFFHNSPTLQFNQYQYDGIKWCIRNEREAQAVGGGIIADEMGLGKTILMIGTMYTHQLQRTLIVVPPILARQWSAEIHKHTAGKHIPLLFHRLVRENSLLEANVVIATYSMLLSTKCVLKNIEWDRIIFDEAHHLRNAATRRYAACQQLKTRIRWLITGTPIQNRKQDFYHLCNLVGLEEAYYSNPENYSHFLLRRTKQEVGIELPPVNRVEYVVDWHSRAEKRLAKEIHSLLPNQTYVKMSQEEDISAPFQKTSSLTALLRARQSCILPNLMRRHMEHMYGCFPLPKNMLEALESSSKIDMVIQKILERRNNGNGKLVFCHYQHEIDVIAKRLRVGGMEKVTTYDGRTTGCNSVSLDTPADALIIQIQTGCEGLNLQQHFSEIYFVSPHWNPSVEDQAIARCHRIGQTKEVHVFSFTMRGFDEEDQSMEKYVTQVQEHKREIAQELWQPLTQPPQQPQIVIPIAEEVLSLKEIATLPIAVAQFIA